MHGAWLDKSLQHQRLIFGVLLRTTARLKSGILLNGDPLVLHGFKVKMRMIYWQIVAKYMMYLTTTDYIMKYQVLKHHSCSFLQKYHLNKINLFHNNFLDFLKFFSLLQGSRINRSKRYQRIFLRTLHLLLYESARNGNMIIPNFKIP